MRLYRRLLPLLAGFGPVLLAGCQSTLDQQYRASLPPEQGTARIKGLMEGSSVRRNRLGMPLIESSNVHDALFTLGYVHASDRISQMAGLRLTAEGRLSELAGPATLELDQLMRSLGLRQRAATLYRQASPRLRQQFEVYAAGVNAWLYRNAKNLPIDLASAGYRPEYWKGEDSALLFCLLEFALGVNLQEEIASLRLASQVGSERLGWLLPIYPDEPIPHNEAAKLAGLKLDSQKLDGQLPALGSLENSTRQLADLHMLGVAASNNWAFSGQRTRSGKTLLANDTHLPLAMPSLWNFVHLRTPQYQVAGVSVAGIPAVVAGFNGKLAWSMTMVMGDSQDLFLEQTRERNGQLEYLANGQWQPARQREETFFIKGQAPVRMKVWETRHGPLLNAALGTRKHMLQPLETHSQYGLALQRPDIAGDRTLDAFIELSLAQSVDQAHDAVRRIQAIDLNLLYADAEHMAWQVTGRYPNRRSGRGLIPSPGWNDDYAWDGYADDALYPFDQDPASGWLGTANQRSAPAGYGVQLSASWFYPERSERIAELAQSRSKQDAASMIAMQYDQQTPFARKLQQMLWDKRLSSALQQAIDQLPATDASRARQALARLKGFDGRLDSHSADAAVYSAFLQTSMQQIFADELGGSGSPAWQALVEAGNLSYSAQADHLLGREDSPFWDDTRTPQQEDKAIILARSLAASMHLLEERLGSDSSQWQWGKLHSYHWRTDGQKLAHWMGAGQQLGLKALDGYLGRGPFPAGGDHSTLNASSWHWGQDFDSWLIPAMRMVVDFGADEPLMAHNSSGQSGNPASRHYADGIDAWMNRQYQSFPFQARNLDTAYGSQRLSLQPQP